MATNVVLFSDDSGNVRVVIPVPALDTPEFLDILAIKAIENAGLSQRPYHKVTTADIPMNRRWRNAWRLSAGNVVHDLSACRQIRRTELLQERDKRLQKVREKVQIAQEDGDNAKVIVLRNRAKTLRQLETQVDTDLASISDLNVLDAYIPATLQTSDN